MFSYPGQCGLYLACLHGHMAVVSALLLCELDVNAAHQGTGDTPLHGTI
jgi:hypothetical protein